MLTCLHCNSNFFSHTVIKWLTCVTVLRVVSTTQDTLLDVSLFMCVLTFGTCECLQRAGPSTTCPLLPDRGGQPPVGNVMQSIALGVYHGWRRCNGLYQGLLKTKVHLNVLLCLFFFCLGCRCGTQGCRKRQSGMLLGRHCKGGSLLKPSKTLLVGIWTGCVKGVLAKMACQGSS